jgi:hypothetical protein
MRSGFYATLIALMLVIGGAETAPAQGTYSGKSVYGMFGPRVLGQTLQSPVERKDRGIARDAYGDFLGRNQAYSGMRFPEVRPRGREALPPATPGPTAPPAPEQAPESQPRPEEWLRSPTSESEATPESPTIESGFPGTSWVPGARGGAPRPGWAAAVVGYSSRPAMDPFSGRIASMLESTARIKKRSPIRVDVVGETAILRGRVATRQDRELAENLVRLEPGVWDVKNLLIAEDSPRVTTINVRPAGQ